MDNNQPAGIGFTGLLTIAFIVLKLTHVIAWSWWWVLAPLWIGAGFVVALVGLVFLVAYVKVTIEDRDAKRIRNARR